MNSSSDRKALEAARAVAQRCLDEADALYHEELAALQRQIKDLEATYLQRVNRFQTAVDSLNELLETASAQPQPGHDPETTAPLRRWPGEVGRPRKNPAPVEETVPGTSAAGPTKPVNKMRELLIRALTYPCMRQPVSNLAELVDSAIERNAQDYGDNPPYHGSGGVRILMVRLSLGALIKDLEKEQARPESTALDPVVVKRIASCYGKGSLEKAIGALTTIRNGSTTGHAPVVDPDASLAVPSIVNDKALD